MGMYYHIELKNEELSFVNFPDRLSYFFEQIGGFEEKSIVSQIEKILDIDLSVFQNTYFEMEFEDDFDEVIDPDSFWISTDELIDKLTEFKNKMDSNLNYFSKIVFNPKDDFNISSKLGFDFEKIAKYYEENPLACYPSNNGIITEKKLTESVNELLETLKDIKTQGEDQIRLVYM